MESNNKPSAPALERGLLILEALAKSRGGLTLSQLTRYLHLPKSSVFCLLRTLEQFGYLCRDAESGKYTVTLRICTLANMALNGFSLREKAKPFLRRLCEATRLTVHMGVLEQASCVLIEKISPPGTVPVATWVGKHLSLHCTALGKAVSAYLPEAQLEASVHEHGFLRHNENTISSLKRFKQDLAIVRERGYALDDEEEEIGIRCIGAPIFHGSRAIGGISIVGTTNEIHGERLASLAMLVNQTANEISERAKMPEPEVYDINSPRSPRDGVSAQNGTRTPLREFNLLPR